MTHEILKDLAHFTGSETWYRHGLVPKVTFTDGAKYVADQAGAYWLLDEIALAQQFEPRIRAEALQVWTLKVIGTAGELTVEDGNGRVVRSKTIPFTDFPEPGITLWFTDSVILLPSEY